jgi:hypothetical protein
MLNGYDDVMKYFYVYVLHNYANTFTITASYTMGTGVSSL